MFVRSYVRSLVGWLDAWLVRWLAVVDCCCIVSTKKEKSRNESRSVRSVRVCMCMKRFVPESKLMLCCDRKRRKGRGRERQSPNIENSAPFSRFRIPSHFHSYVFSSHLSVICLPHYILTNKRFSSVSRLSVFVLSFVSKHTYGCVYACAYTVYPTLWVFVCAFKLVCVCVE